MEKKIRYFRLFVFWREKSNSFPLPVRKLTSGVEINFRCENRLPTFITARYFSRQITMCRFSINLVFFPDFSGFTFKTCQGLWNLWEITRPTSFSSLWHLSAILPSRLFDTTFDKNAKKVQAIWLVLFRVLSRYDILQKP